MEQLLSTLGMNTMGMEVEQNKVNWVKDIENLKYMVGGRGSSITSITNLHHNMMECIIVLQEILRCSEDYLVSWLSYLSVDDAYYGC